MRDNIALKIGGAEIKAFKSYSVKCSLYHSANDFSVELFDPKAGIAPGARCELFVNSAIELSGHIETVKRSVDKKGGMRLSAGGRDNAALLVDGHIESFAEMKNIALPDMARALASDYGFKKFQCETGPRGAGKELRAAKHTVKLAKPSPGETVFDFLYGHAKGFGLLMYALPDYTLAFAEQARRGGPEYSVIIRKDGKGNNALSGEMSESVKNAYSRVTLMAEKQDGGDTQPGGHQIRASAENRDFPRFHKPLVKTLQTGDGLEKAAEQAIRKQNALCLRLTYRLPGHSQNGMNFMVNAVCSVEDESLGIADNFLVVEREFIVSRERIETVLTLGRLEADIELEAGND